MPVSPKHARINSTLNVIPSWPIRVRFQGRSEDFYITQAIESRDRARAARATLGYSYLRAPFDGEIGDLSSVKIGDYVKTGQAITGIVSNSLLWTNMDVPAAVANQVRRGSGCC